MERSESIINLMKALQKAQSEAEAPALDKENTHLKYKYASFQSLKNAVMPALEKNGIAITFLPSTIEGANYLEILVIHESGEYITGRYKVEPEKTGMQATGAAWTYLKRYMLGGLMATFDSEDDDAADENPQKAKDSGQKPYENVLISEKNLKELNEELNGFPQILKAILDKKGIKQLKELPLVNFGEILMGVKQMKATQLAKAAK